MNAERLMLPLVTAAVISLVFSVITGLYWVPTLVLTAVAFAVWQWTSR